MSKQLHLLRLADQGQWRRGRGSVGRGPLPLNSGLTKIVLVRKFWSKNAQYGTITLIIGDILEAKMKFYAIFSVGNL